MRSGGQAERGGRGETARATSTDAQIATGNHQRQWGSLPRARACLIWRDRAWLVAVQAKKKRTPRAWLDIKWQLL